MIEAPDVTQSDVLATAQSLATEFATRAAEYDRTGAFPFANFDAIRAAGLSALNVPQSHGGHGASLLTTVQVLEALAVGDGSTALSFAMHTKTIGEAVDAGSWPPHIFDHVCRATVNEGALINAVASEPELGSPSRGGKPKTTATPVRDDDGAVYAWRINGHKNFVSLSPALDFMIVSALLLDGSEETARFLVEPGAGVEIVETWDALGMRATGSHDVLFHDVEVRDDAIISRGAEGAAARVTYLNPWFMLCASSVYLGVAQGGLDAAARFAWDRVPSALGKPIAELDSIRRQLGQAEFLIEQARMGIYYVAGLYDELAAQDVQRARATLSPQIAVAKVGAADNAVAAMEHCMRAVGGQSMSRTLPLERFYRDVRGGLSHPINEEVAYLMLGRRALDRVVSGNDASGNNASGNGA